jgi:hemerythrin HHE cation binding domain-containing protein
MSDLAGAAKRAVDQPQGDMIAILLEQHQRIRELFAHVKEAEGKRKQQAFDELRALLAVHETAEEMILRPISSKDAGTEVTDARNEEEREAARDLTVLEMMDVSSAEFDRMFADFERAVLDHAGHEEQDEFPLVRSREDQDTLLALGRTLRAAERIAPTHPHPSTAGSPVAQWAMGPFASLVDRSLDALKNARRDSRRD